MTTKTKTKTEIVIDTFMGTNPQEILRTIPHNAGHDRFSDRPVQVFVELGRRPSGSGTEFRGGGFITVADVVEEGEQNWGLDFSEGDATKLLAALVIALAELRTAREAQA